MTMTSDRLIRVLCPVAGVLLTAAMVLIFFWVPTDADQGISQRIFYLHVPVALISYLYLGVGACYAVRYLRRRDPRDDLRSYVGVHAGVTWGTLVLLTGPIWAKKSWGVWWRWDDQQLNTFLIIFLFYCAYFMLRFSLDNGPRRAAFSAAYAIFGIAMVPLSIVAVHLGQSLLHPQLFDNGRSAMEGTMWVTFLISLLGVLSLSVVMYQVELRSKLVAQRVDRLVRRGRGEHVLDPA